MGIGGLQVPMLVDTGAMRTLIPRDVYGWTKDRLGPLSIPRHPLKGATGDDLDILGETQPSVIEFQGRNISVPILVMNVEASAGILGMDILEAVGASIHVKQETILTDTDPQCTKCFSHVPPCHAPPQ